jgi:hypothetical protein
MYGPVEVWSERKEIHVHAPKAIIPRKGFAIGELHI